MKTSIKKGTTIGPYTVKEELRTDAFFCWVLAMNGKDGQEVVLQVIPQESGFSSDVIRKVKEHFDDLTTKLGRQKKRKRLLIPQLEAYYPEYPVVAVYEKFPSETLQDWLGKNYKAACKMWEEAADSLRIVHRWHVIHGLLTPNSFLVDEGEVYLSNFGYAPFLEDGNRNKMGSAKSFLAPELAKSGNLVAEADIYAFAKTLASWEPKVETAPWYKQATEEDLKNRFSKMSAVIPPMNKTLEDLLKQLEEEEEEDVETEPKQDGPGLVRHYQLVIKTDPSDASAGQVTADPRGETRSRTPGWYARTADQTPEVTLKAKPGKGWRFKEWSGALSGNDTTSKVEMDDHKTVTAHFEKVPTLFLNEITRPDEGGIVEGAGEYEVGATAKVRAVPKPGWVFKRWAGAATVTSPTAEIVMDREKEVVARFVKEGCKTKTERLGDPLTVAPFLAGSTAAALLWEFEIATAAASLAGAAGALLVSALIFAVKYAREGKK